MIIDISNYTSVSLIDFDILRPHQLAEMTEIVAIRPKSSPQRREHCQESDLKRSSP
jgi:hypothetical protein